MFLDLGSDAWTDIGLLGLDSLDAFLGTFRDSGVSFGSLLGMILEPWARSAILAKIEPAL